MNFKFWQINLKSLDYVIFYYYSSNIIFVIYKFKKCLGKIAKKFLKYTADKRKNLRHRRALFKTSGKYRRKTVGGGPDENYGLAQPLDTLSDKEIEARKTEFIRSITLSVLDKNKLEIATRSQANEQSWFIERRNRLTASNFGRVCKMRSNTSCKNTVYDILYSNPQTNAMEYGKLSEDKALKELEGLIKKPIQKCGLFIDDDIPYLAATPGT